MIGGTKRDRAYRNRIAGLTEKYSAPANDVVRADCAEFRAGREVGHTGIETGADHEVIVVPEQLVGIGCLQRDAARCRMSRRSIVLSQHRVRIEGIGKLNSVQAVCRVDAVTKTKQRRIGVAGLRSRWVAILHLLIEDPHMGDTFDRPGRCDLDLPGQIEIANAVVQGLRRGVGGTIILLQQFDGYRRGRAEIIFGRTHVEVEFSSIVLGADVAIETANVRRRKVAKSVVVYSFECDVGGKIVDLLAPLRRSLHAAERSTHGVDFGAVIVEAVFHLHNDRAAERIQPERGIVGHQIHGLYGGGRNQIPVDGIAECFIDAHAVLINRKPLRSARNRGSNEAAKIYARRKWIAGDFIDGDARHVVLQGIGDVQRIGSLDLIGVDDIDTRRHLVGIDAGAGKRRRRIHPRDRRSPDHASRSFIATALDALLRPGHHDRWQLVTSLGRILGASTVIPSQQPQRYRRKKQVPGPHPSHSQTPRVFWFWPVGCATLSMCRPRPPSRKTSGSHDGFFPVIFGNNSRSGSLTGSKSARPERKVFPP